MTRSFLFGGQHLVTDGSDRPLTFGLASGRLLERLSRPSDRSIAEYPCRPAGAFAGRMVLLNRYWRKMLRIELKSNFHCECRKV
jgi:hypothetical protein